MAHHTRPTSTTAIDTPHDAAAEILPILRPMSRGIALLLLDEEHRPLVGIAINDAPRNEFEPVVRLLTELQDRSVRAVILGVLSTEAQIPEEPFDFGDTTMDTSERLAVEAATVHAWAEFACALSAIGIVLLDVIECTPWNWASAHAPSAPYLPRGRALGVRTRTANRQRRASSAR
jgi:hypothetical protein